MVPALLLLTLLLVAGCGGERSFEPGEFVDEANREGAGLILGDPLTTTQEGVEIFQVSFDEGLAAPDRQGHAHSGGALVVTEGSEAATDEFERCESAATLTCYRAGNVVVYFEGEPTDEHIARVDGAIRELASE